MKRIIEEAKEFQRRFNFELENYIKKLQDIQDQQEKNQQLLLKPNSQNTNEKFVTIKRLCEIYPAFTVGTIRAMLFSNKWNIVAACEKRIGKKILIDVQAFEEWIKKPKHKGEEYSHLGFSRK
jgi:hypothetical protein